jgi:uncharacterized protein (TIGR03790 family)
MAVACICAILGCARAALALDPDEIALVVNSRVPAGRELAELYARKRHIPDGRIIEINPDPLTGNGLADEIPFATYDPRVASPVRQWIASHNLRGKIKCLVSFYGVPLRIGPRKLTLPEAGELDSLKQELAKLRGTIEPQVVVLEQSARDLDPKFAAGSGNDLPQLTQRLSAAIASLSRSLPQVSQFATRNARFLQIISTAENLLGSGRVTELMSQPVLSRLAPRPPTTQDVVRAKTEIVRSEQAMAEANGFDPDAAHRKTVRELARKSLGAIGEAQLLSAQIDTFRTEETQSALDSELALLWWRGYPRARWLLNPLQWRAKTNPIPAPAPTLMVMRLDGPTVQIVRSVIETSIKVEDQGLAGQVVLDARGLASGDSYGKYDQILRNLNALLRARTSLKVTFDDKPEVIPPHSLHDLTALYCGWYSLRNYQPPGPFAPGAVGFHVASFELVSLRNRDEHGWVRGLLSDGVCATVGSVAEPYLQSFPPADEFFSLLLTGKLTLAEVYWRTTPMVSWMQDCVGDPLYLPYRKNPALRVEDLPAPLRDAIGKF